MSDSYEPFQKESKSFNQSSLICVALDVKEFEEIAIEYQCYGQKRLTGNSVY